MLLEESITRKFDTLLWFLTLENSTEFQVTVNLSKPFPICPSLPLYHLFAHLKDCVPCVCVSVCLSVSVFEHEGGKKMQWDVKMVLGKIFTLFFQPSSFLFSPPNSENIWKRGKPLRKYRL